MKTIYTPIAVSSGELPEIDLEEKADLSIDVFFIDCDNSKHIGFYNFTTKEWISYEDCYVAPKFWLKKEEVPELTEEEIKHKADIIEDIIWDEIELNHDKNNDRCTADNQSVKNAALRITATTYPNKVEVKWEELKVGDNTRYGIIEEFVEKDGVKMMRSNNPYGTWPIESIK